MENQAFEMHGENAADFSIRKERPRKEENPGSRSLLRIFLLCLLAGVITTALGVLAVSLVVVDTAAFRQENRDEAPVTPKLPGTGTDTKFRFLHHLTKSKVHKYPGGEIQWARFRADVTEYESPEVLEFGTSLHQRRAGMSFGTLRIRSRGLRAPHWHFNANEHGFLLQGSAWIGVIDADGATATTYNVSAGQVIFFPRNTVHWVKNVGSEDCLFLLFFSTHDELQTLDVDDAFFSTPEDVAARALMPEGGVQFIRTFKRPDEDQAINLPANLDELVRDPSYPQSPDQQVWKYFFDLRGSKEFPFPGGVFQWARYRKNGTGLTENEQIYSQFLNEHEGTLTLATLRIFSNALGQPHFHFNANELGYVASGCGQVGVILADGAEEFSVGIGDVIFFPEGSQHYVRSQCQEELLLVLAYNTGQQLETLRMTQYFHGTADHILAQLFFKDQAEFKKFPKPSS